LLYFTAFGILYGHLVYIVVIWSIFPQEKSGNPAPDCSDLILARLAGLQLANGGDRAVADDQVRLA
jgi:hypothetical protein